MRVSSKKVRSFYNTLEKNYLSCWSSRAKKDISRFELDFISRALASGTADKPLKVLEIGVGPGRIAEKILQYPVEYYGVDISDKMVEYSSNRFHGNSKIKKISVADISQRDPYRSIKFDLIIAMRVVYYSHNWKEIIDKLAKKLKPGGAFVFCTLNRRSTAVLGGLLTNDYLTGHYTDYQELVDVLNASGLLTRSLNGYARLPDVIYDRCRGSFSALLLRTFESFLTLLLGKIFLMRMFYVVATRP